MSRRPDRVGRGRFLEQDPVHELHCRRRDQPRAPRSVRKDAGAVPARDEAALSNAARWKLTVRSRSSSWSRCLHLVYADSLTPVSSEGYKFSRRGKGESPADRFARSITRVSELPCDVLIAPHPEFIGLDEKLARLKKDPSTNPFIDSGACRAFAAAAKKRLDQRLAEEKKGA